MVEWYLPSDEVEWPAFWHMSTHIRAYPSANALCCGDTVWLGKLEGQSVGMAWEWVELRRGVVLMSDPNSILTNTRFLDHALSVQTELNALISANRVANLLPWQDAVCAVLQAHRSHPEVADTEVELEFSAPFGATKRQLDDRAALAA